MNKNEVLKAEVAIGFIEYRDRVLREDETCFHRACKQAGGMLSWVSPRIEKIYEDYINKVPIESYIIPEEKTFWEYNTEGKLIHSTDKGGSQEGLKKQKS